MKPSTLRVLSRALCAVSIIALAAGCGKGKKAEPAAPSGSAEEAAAFVDKVETTYRDAFEEAGRVQWVNATYINYDTDWLAAKSAAELTKMSVDFANEAAKFDGTELTPDLRRKLDFMKLGIVLPAPSLDGAAKELADITTRLGSAYSTGNDQPRQRGVQNGARRHPRSGR